MLSFGEWCDCNNDHDQVVVSKKEEIDVDETTQDDSKVDIHRYTLFAVQNCAVILSVTTIIADQTVVSERKTIVPSNV